MAKLKVLLVQTVKNNLGDPILADNDCYLLEKALGKDNVTVLRYKINYSDCEQLNYVDAVVFGGGIIKTKTERFWLFMSEILEKANELNLPVFMSAVGVEPYEDSPEAKRLKAALNLPCLKGISVRDDIESLKTGWIDAGSNCKIYEAIDPAINCPFTYNVEVKHKDKASAKPHVGIGIIRNSIFSSYGHPEINRAHLLNFWEQVVYLLEQKGFRWTIFTNGGRPDEYDAEEVLAYIGHGDKISAPYDNLDLINKLNQFDCLIGGRMHSNIIAYSLGIPSIGFIWNQKLRFWSEKTGHPERFIELDDMTPENTVSALIRAYEEGIAPVSEEQFRSVYEPLKEFADKWIKEREKKQEKYDFSRKCAALGLGTIELKNACSNSAEAFAYSIKESHKVFELNLSYTSDNILVCAYGWEEETLKQLYNIRTHKKVSALCFDEFIQAKAHLRYPTLSFKDFIEILKTQGSDSFEIILEAGTPDNKEFNKMVQEVSSLICQPEFKKHQFYITVQNQKQVQTVKKSKDILEAIYVAETAPSMFPNNVSENNAASVISIPSEKTEVSNTLLKKYNSDIQFCKENGISIIAVTKDAYNNYFEQLLDQSSLCAYIQFCEITDDIIKYSQRDNVKFIGTTNYTANYINKLTH